MVILKQENKLKLFLTILLVILFFSSSYAVKKITVNTESITPSTLKPGGDIVLHLNLMNDEDEFVAIDSVELLLKDNFLLKSVNKNYANESICGKCSKSLIYYLKVKPGIESGIYPIELKIHYGKVYTTTANILLKIEGEPTLVISPQIFGEVYPGNVFNITFKINNSGTSDANNIKIFSKSNSIGFLDKNSLYIAKIKKKDSYSITAPIIASKQIANGYFQIPFLITYEDNQNKKYEDEEQLGINLLGKSNLVIENIKYPPSIYVNKDFELNLRIENDGFGDAKNVMVKLDGNFIGQKKGYFGTIERDDDMPYIFSLIPQSSDSNKINMKLTYDDDYGSHEKNFSFDLNVVSTSDQTKLYYLIGGICIFLIIILVLYAKHKSKRNKIEY